MPVHVSTQKIVSVKAELQKEAVYLARARAGAGAIGFIKARLGLGLRLGLAQGGEPLPHALHQGARLGNVRELHLRGSRWWVWGCR